MKASQSLLASEAPYFLGHVFEALMALGVREFGFLGRFLGWHRIISTVVRGPSP